VEVPVAVRNEPSTEVVALDDRWTRHCLQREARRSLRWGAAGAAAFVGQLLLVLAFGVAPGLAAVLLLFSAAVFLFAARPGRRVAHLLADEPWHYVRVRWEGRRLVLPGSPPVRLVLHDAGPLVRGRIARHRRAWLVEPDAAGHTVVTFRGVPRLFHATVFHPSRARISGGE
jgi:hypothetical protein